MAKQFNQSNFEAEVLNHKGLVIVDFFATWCGPCKMLSPVIDKLAEEVGDKVNIGKVDIDENMELAQKYSIMSVPTLVFIKDGETVDTLMGVQSSAKIKEYIEKYQ